MAKGEEPDLCYIEEKPMADDVKAMTVAELGEWNEDESLTRNGFASVRKALEQRERLAGLFEQPFSHSLPDCQLEFRQEDGGWVIHPDKDADWDVEDAVLYESAIDALEAVDKLEAEQEKPNARIK